jgi:uncharacterized membrane protein
MSDISRTRRTLIFICLAAISCAALAHAGTSLLIAILTPIWFFVTTVVGLSIVTVDEHYDIQPSPVPPVFSPRPPPIH